jgi:hypothetical protein
LRRGANPPCRGRRANLLGNGWALLTCNRVRALGAAERVSVGIGRASIVHDHRVAVGS